MNRKLIRFVAISLLSANLTTQVIAQIHIPHDQRIEWIPGIPGSITHVNGPLVNVINYGADPTGKQDSYFAFYKAMETFSESGGVIYIPSGVYRLDSMLNITRNNVVFRGDSAEIPKILSYYPGNSIQIGSIQNNQWYKLLSGYSFGSFSVQVEDAGVFINAGYAEIQQENDSVIMYKNPKWKQDWALNSVGQLFEIDSIEGNTIYFKQPLHIDFSSKQNPVIRPVKMIENVGFENIYIEKMAPCDHTFNFEYTAHCWIKGVESYNTRRTHVCLTACLENEVRESFFHKSFFYGDGGSGYGVECRVHTTNVLIENNIFDSLRHAMLVQVGANGNVYAYNYSLHPVQGTDVTNLNVGWVPPDISIHGHYPFMNLFEGNYVSETGIADYWGPSGPGNTFFRNYVYGDGIILYDHSNNQNIMGNVTTMLIYNDPAITNTFVYANVITSDIQSMDFTDLPPSLYLKVAPDYFSGFVWPAFGSSKKFLNMLPAQKKYMDFIKHSNTNAK